MKDNYPNIENFVTATAEPTQAKKKAMLFIAICAVVPFLFEQCISLAFADMVTVNTADLIDAASIFITDVFTAIFLIVLGIILEKKRSGVIQFLGIFALGTAMGEIVNSILTLFAEAVFSISSAEASVCSLIQTLFSVITVIITVVFSCWLYNKIKFNNTGICVTYNEYSKLKKNMVFAYICSYFIPIILGAVAVLIEAVVIGDERSEIYNHPTLFIIAYAVDVLNLVSVFAIVYFFGYKLKKCSSDGLKFSACYYFPQFIITCLMSLLSTVIMLLENGMNNGTLSVQTGLIVSIISLFTPILWIVAEIILMFIAIKHFFPKEQVKAYDYIPQPFDCETISEELNDEESSTEIIQKDSHFAEKDEEN